jgi:hypothetical protein
VNINDKFEPEYSTSAGEVVTEIMKIFDSGLEALLNVQLLEQKLLTHLFKSNNKTYLKVPLRPSEMPDLPDPNDKRQLPDENTWIYEAYTKLRSKILQTIEPLDQYLATLAKYKNEFKLDPA